MTQPPRPYRAGLGLPPTIIIRSSPGPSRLPLDYYASQESGNQEDEENLDTHSNVEKNVFNAYQNRRSAHLYPQRDSEYLSREHQWKEWNINPTLHGPPKLVLPPKFVISSNEYDELGRSINDGVGVSVDKGKQRESRIDKEDGGKVADWYLNLASSKSASGITSGTNSGSITPATKVDEVIDVDEWELRAGPSRSVQPQTIKQESTTPSSSVSSITMNKPPLHVHSKDWFIRRALLHTDPSSQPQVMRTTSIGSLLNIKPGDNLPQRQYQPQYVLGPDNKGYEILKDKLGWNGGGLGKPPGWVDGVDPRSEVASLSAREANAEHEGPAIAEDKDDVGVIELDGNGQPIIDLTLSADSESDSEFSAGEETVYGPGRTAPIATQLKLDRKGLGHRSTSSFSNSKRKIPSLEKKVTHTHKEIEDAKRRSRFGYGKHHGQGLELGKKGKIKWKELDRNERDERRAIKAALG